MSTCKAFLSLPKWIIYQVLYNLKCKDLVKFSKTCQFAKEPTDDRFLWKKIFIRDFNPKEVFQLSQDWRSVYVMVHMSMKNNTAIALKTRLETALEVVDNFKDQNDKLSDAVHQLKATLSTVTHSDTDAQTTELKEKGFRNIVKKKIKQSPDGLIKSKNTRGRPQYLKPVRLIETLSDQASSRTLLERNQSNESFLLLSSTLFHSQRKNRLLPKNLKLVN